MNPKLSEFIWAVADLLRGDYKQADYGKVILPFTLLRRLDCVLCETREAVLKAQAANQGAAPAALEHFLLRASGQSFYNTSRYDLPRLLGDPPFLKANLLGYLRCFSPNARDIFERYKFADQIEYLDSKNLLYQVTEKFAGFDLHPKVVSNLVMGHIFEELIRRFAELSNETAGEHFTPRDAIHLAVNLLFIEDDEALHKPKVIRSIYDPTAGTGGMLSVAEDHLQAMNPGAKLVMYGQELNDESYAICKADMLIKGQDVANIVAGNTLSEDGHAGRRFDYLISNPPFGVDWKKVQKEVTQEHEQQGYNGRFGPGLPRINDGALLFNLHLLSKMRPVSEGGSRMVIVHNGSPLFSGGAGSGESEIRRFILENDLLEGIVALPTDMFYNTGIATYLWVLTNHKRPERKGKVQLVNASGLWQKMKKSLGSKRKEMSPEQIEEVTRLYGAFQEGPLVKIFDTEDFGYTTITVERPERDAKWRVVTDRKGNAKPDSSLRDTENVPLKDDIQAYFEREVLPHAPDAWIDEKKSKVGYEIPFTRHFYEYQPPRPLGVIDADLKACVARIQDLLNDVAQVKGSNYPAYKPSNTDWMGDVPTDWNVDRLKWTVDSSRNGVWGDEPDGGQEDIACIRVADFDRANQTVIVEEPTIRKIRMTDQEGRVLQKGDLLLEKSGGGEGWPVGFVVEYTHDLPAVCSNFIARMKPSAKVRSRYLRYLHHAMYAARVNVRSIKQTSGIQNLDAGSYFDELAPYPPPPEQDAIGIFLDRETAKIDTLIAEQRALIERLQEHRSALITAVVTGTIDVRDAMKGEA